MSTGKSTIIRATDKCLSSLSGGYERRKKVTCLSFQWSEHVFFPSTTSCLRFHSPCHTYGLLILQTGMKTGVGYHNPRFHRRSKSANCRIIDHQPRSRIPEGTIMQPRMPKFSRATKKVSAEDLRKCSDYVLTHQEVDQQGNLTTHIVKVIFDSFLVTGEMRGEYYLLIES